MTASGKAAWFGLPPGLVLPAAPQPAGAYRPAMISDDLILLSGFGPRDAEGQPIVGQIGREFSIEQGKALARNVGGSILAVLQNTLGDLGRVRQVLRLTGMIYAVPEFTQHPQIIDGCSELLHEVFGESGAHARMAFGVASLPFGSPVAIDCICRIEP
jgi:enamine deaminase RidA (YjgF/YER057c/UK114 family)